MLPAATSRPDATPTVAPTPVATLPGEPTAEPAAATAVKDRPFRRRIASAARFLLVLGVAAVIVLGFAILAAWARQGYFVAFDDDGQVGIYQGRSVLWFEPTLEATGPFDRSQLDEESVDLVYDEPNFESQGSAERYVAERLSPTTTTTSTTTTTTVPPTTAPPTTVADDTEATTPPATNSGG